MKCRILFLAVFLLGSLSARAQTSSSPQPAPSPQTQSRTASEARPTSNTREIDEAFTEMRAMEVRQVDDTSNSGLLTELTRNIYRKPNKAEMKVLAPGAHQLDKYASFLRQPDTGIVKLHGDSSCAENPKVLAAKENCVQYSMPGAGTAYSFRVESHRVPHLADLILSKNVLKTDGVLQQGMMVSLGDVPLEEVTLQTKGLKYLVAFEPFSDAESLSEFDRQLSTGVKSDGFVYGMGVYVKEQATFALRSVAYRGKFMRSVNGISYNEMDFDKRRDIVVAFRILEQDANGNVTILWKMLSSKDAPIWKAKQIKQIKDNK